MVEVGWATAADDAAVDPEAEAEAVAAADETALVVAIMVGLATVWTKSQIFETILDNFQKMVLLLINRILIPILPFFIAFSTG